MEIFLIHNKDKNTYQEVLQLSCVMEAANKRGGYKFEKNFMLGCSMPAFIMKSSYLLSDMNDIKSVETIYRMALTKLVKEQRKKKQQNHMAQIANCILRVNNVEVFNLKKDFEKLWEVTDEQLKARMKSIKFEILENGREYESNIKEGYLI